MATGLRLYPVYVYNKTAESDTAEYNDEATMVKSNLEIIRKAADCIDEMVNDKDNVAEWAQEKIAITKAMLNSVCDYLMSKQATKTV